jgi:hypothetical protein
MIILLWVVAALFDIKGRISANEYVLCQFFLVFSFMSAEPKS